MFDDALMIREVLHADGDEDLLPLDGIGAQARHAVQVVPNLIVAHGVGEEVVDAVRARGDGEIRGLAHLAIAPEGVGLHGLAGDAELVVGRRGVG